MIMLRLLSKWPTLMPEKAIELLDFAYADSHVRKFAVKCLENISDDDLLLYILQLVQAIKYESYLYTDLVVFLLKRSLTNQHIGHYLFWLMHSEMRQASVSIPFGLILEAYCRGAKSHINILIKQSQSLGYLKQINEILRQEANKRKDRDKLKATLHELINQSYYQLSFTDLINPLDPKFHLGKIKTEKCRFMDSKMKPLWLVFTNEDLGSSDNVIMFKFGDGQFSFLKINL